MFYIFDCNVSISAKNNLPEWKQYYYSDYKTIYKNCFRFTYTGFCNWIESRIPFYTSHMPVILQVEATSPIGSTHTSTAVAQRHW